MTAGLDKAGENENEILFFEKHIRINFKNRITFRSQKRLVDQVVDLKSRSGISRFIIDTRGCSISYTLPERYETGSYFAEKAKNEIVVATIIDKANLTGLVEDVAHNRGATKLAIVTSEADALSWIESN